jgi:hypothetical protein
MSTKLKELIKQELQTDISGKWVATGVVETLAQRLLDDVTNTLQLTGYDDASVAITEYYKD